ncbi:MAG: LamG domain-containing protein [Planctomycetota bacterium]|jgi:hypothetical protein
MAARGDLNADEKVDFKDFVKLAQYWQENEGLVDIAPLIGNGIVDFRDLTVLAEYWLEDFRLVAHWKLDETEGTIAHDSVGDNDGFIGGPVCQPTDGKVDGALEFDGTYDFVSTLFVLDPAKGSFSVFAWIKGCSPGQVVISQMDGNGTGQTWLGADPSNGTLTTALTDGSALTKPLVSEFVITDGQWHHIGVVLNGSRRYLYADGVEIAKDIDALEGLQVSDGGLYFGVGKDFDAASCFSGLIDDVRIYDVALSTKEIEELVR